MYKVTFKGVKSERSVHCPPGTAPSVKRALEARGYEVTVGGDSSPWQEDPGREQMIAVTGSLTKGGGQGLLFLAEDEEFLDAAWEAIHIYFPDAYSNPVETLNRPA